MTLKITEPQFALTVEDLFIRFGWAYMHIKPAKLPNEMWVSRMNPEGKGWLDYTAVRPPRILVCELKDAYSKMTPEQEKWWALWEGCQVTIDGITLPELYLWRPKDFNEIARILR